MGPVSLRTLVEKIELLRSVGPLDREIGAVVADSRNAGPGSLFVAVPGLTVDGHDYLDQALAQGAAAVLVGEGRCREWTHPGTTCLEVRDTRLALGQVASAFYGGPAARMQMVAVTGTNGKTSTTYLIEAIIRQAGGNPGVIGTVNYRYNAVSVPASFTTPDPISLHRILSEMAAGGVSHVIMETSSHALAQKRIAGIQFDVALFTNLSRDHLDFHADMEEYFTAKKELFLKYLKESGLAVVLCDEGEEEDWGRRLIVELREQAAWGGRRIIDCGLAAAELEAKELSGNLNGTSFVLKSPDGSVTVRSRMVGGFNVKNLLGAAGLARALQIPQAAVVEGLAAAKNPPGRLEQVNGPEGVGVFVDFAHSPDALEKVLKTMRPLTEGRLIVIFGCGGDRDRGKRPLMGKVAGMLADVVVLTSDNPRSERPQDIVREIEQGLLDLNLPRLRLEALLGRDGRRGYDILLSRRSAIRESIRKAKPGDLVLICGKGHETCQISEGTKSFFDDCLEAAEQAAVIAW